MREEKECINCGKGFIPTCHITRQKFCNDTCRYRYNNAKRHYESASKHLPSLWRHSGTGRMPTRAMAAVLQRFIKAGPLGYYTEIYFPQKSIWFIAINDGVDSLVESSNDFNPIRNWANELHAKESSKKVRAVKKLQAERGERTSGKPTYGYRKKDSDTKDIVPDEEAVAVVKHIFSLCAAGEGPSQLPVS